MRIRVVHEMVYTYDPPASGVIQVLRVMPRNHDGQYVLRWRVETSEDCRFDQAEDAFGNITHTLTAAGPLARLSIAVDGEVETQDQNGVVRGAVERFPPGLFLRETPLTTADANIAEMVAKLRRETKDGVLSVLHALLDHLHEEIGCDPDATVPAVAASEAFALRRGSAQDLAHIFIAACRSIEIPARYVSGYFRNTDADVDQVAGHAWAEAFVPDLGWVAFDPANGFCPTEAHIRVAVGLDYLGAAPVRGSRYGAGAETMRIAAPAETSGRQMQS
ncbi:MAG: transglutaminase family protein [Xanthobacteraceae bacterium]